ncbi:SDR family oxidoreductase [Qipengyuania sp. GH1]|uniref:SDR family oxidoreductase n=1 Tax=Qipengyuania aestuarii TaxID=2867241 RepID=UPI001C87E2FB|nr:SDR family oxidoreductase [Qipengyuania aestuarii]MBX7535571.1 SDR family oxidoreductase [Qipengyuania aestuarii]
MKILVAGATGNTGARLVNELADRGHEPVALVRQSSDTSKLPGKAKQRQGDLTDLQDDVTDGCEVVIFAAGSGGDTSAEMTDKVDRDGAIKLIDIAEKSDVRRFVMLSSVGADDPDPDSELAHYLEAKHAADEHLKKSSLEYAILRPVSLTDDGPTGSVRLGDDVDPKGKAARGDVAVLLADAAEQDEWTGAIKLMETNY